MTKLSNGAYSQQYAEMQKKYDAIFEKQNLKEENCETLGNYDLYVSKYTTELEGCHLAGAIYTLLDEAKNKIHSWKCYDNNHDFAQIFEHANGKQYLIYRQELYGYTVYDFEVKETFQYYPQCVLDGYEDFIWTEVHYDPQSNLIAVQGCIWACPWSVLVCDFEDPMQESNFQKDVFGYLKGGYDVYDDATFVRWETDKLVLKCENYVEKRVEMVEISTERIKR